MYDLVIIGAGPGGYVGAIRAAQLGMKVAIVEKEPKLGGTCLRVGCIPSKAMLDSSELYHNVKAHGAEHGVIADPQLDLSAMLARKAKVVDTLTTGIAGLMKKNKIDVVQGTGSIQATGKVQVDGPESQLLETKNILVATGSAPVELPIAKYDGKSIVDSTGALSFESVPEKLIVIGGGAIGLELGSVWSRLGAEVTVVEFFNKIVPAADDDASKALTRALKKQKISIKTSCKVTSAKAGKNGVTVTWETAKGKEESQVADKVLVAVGRKPYTEGVGLDKAGISVDERGRIPVDGQFKAAEGVYAIGDVIAGPMLAHKAEEDAIACVELLAGKAGHVNYDLVPSVVYTWPELASVGKTEAQLKEEGRAYNKGDFPFLANGRAKAAGESDGMVKILADATTDEVLGVHMVGPRVSDLIAETAIAMEFKASSEDIARTCHAHPTFAEATKQAALDVLGRVIEK